jgi:hypothetical protein
LEQRGVFLATASLWTFLGFALLFWLPKSIIVAGAGFILPQLTLLGNFLLLLFLVGIVVSFGMGVISLLKLKRSNNVFAKVKAWIAMSPGLFFLLFYFLSVTG